MEEWPNERDAQGKACEGGRHRTSVPSAGTLSSQHLDCSPTQKCSESFYRAQSPALFPNLETESETKTSHSDH